VVDRSRKSVQVEDLLSAYHLNYENSVEIQRLLLNNMEKGLNKATNAVAKVKMFPTYVRNLPNGTGLSHCYVKLDL
jgi:hexokinase